MYKIIILLIAVIAISSALVAYEPHFMDDPAISPDGDTVCFAYMGDLWLVPFDGGVARRITKSEPAESNPLFSPNGKMIAFNSNRDGSRRIYVMPSEGGEARMVRDESLNLDSWFHDSKNLLASKSWPYEKQSMNFKLSLDGETFTQINSYTDSYSTLSPDDNKIIYNEHGLPYRESYTGSLNGELWEYDLRLKKYTRLTNTETTERYPVYSNKEDKIYFAASDGKIFQLYCVEKRDFGSPKKLTDFKEWSVRDIDIAVKNDRIVFELFDELWRYDPKASFNKVSKIDIDIQEDTWYELDVYEDVVNRFSNIAVSGDEKLLAFSYKYDLFAMPVKGGEVKQLTHDQRGIHDLYILPDNRTIIFSAYEDGVNKLYRVNILEPEKIEKIAWSSDKHIDSVNSAPKKQYIIDYSEGVEKVNRIALMDSTATNFKVIKKDNTPWSNFEISDNGKYALYITRDSGVWNSHIHFYEFETEWDKIIYSNDSWTSGLTWGKDNNSIFFTNDKVLYRMDLSPVSEFKFQKDNWLDIYADSLKTETEKLEDIAVDWDHLNERITPIVKKSNWASVFTVRNDSILYYWQDKKLFKVNYQGKNEKLIYTFNHDWNSWEYIFDKNIVYFVGGNLLYKVDLNSGSSAEINNSFKYSYNKFELNRNVFKQVWGDFGRGFYDPYMHNVDWNSAFDKYYPYTRYMYESGLLSDIVEEMIGEVNASHTGFYPRSERNGRWHQGAYLGAKLDWSTDLKKGILLSKVYLFTQLSEFYKIKDGAVLLSINGIDINKDTAVDPLLRNKAGEKLKLEIEQDGKVIEAEIKALSWREQYQTAYRTWEETRKERVRAANPDLGYIHVKAMGETDFDRFNEDLFSTEFDKKGLILDLRGNSGGRVHDKILEVLSKKYYAWESDRGSGAVKYMAPAKVFDKPIVLLIDEGSFSDGEIFPHIFKFLKMGTVIGVPTSGSVIGTVPHSLMDGSSMRMPRNGWWLADEKMTNMEGNGAQPDIIVEMTPDDIVNDNDTQLQKAIEVLLEEIKTGK
ncbi:MAG: PD40 domain-containing protein [Candidatus Cloacimonetes bacterium]|nr:PD40 domain-containing protein [Candidatus Cloacimonadota bacterium]